MEVGGSDTQLSVVRSKLGIKVDKPSASDMIVFRKKKTIKKKKKKKSQHKLELETMMVGQSQETSPSLPGVIKRMIKEAVVPRASMMPRREIKKLKKCRCKNSRRKL